MIGHEKRTMGVKGRKRDEGKEGAGRRERGWKERKGLDHNTVCYGNERMRRKREVCGNVVCKVGQ